MKRTAAEVRDAAAGYAPKAVKPEAREGYKQTEVGMIPEDWRIAPLRQLVAGLEAGVSVNSVNEDLRSYPHEQSILKTSAVSGGRFFSDESKKIAPRDLTRVRLTVEADSILISRMNTPDLVGECGYIEEDHPNLYLPDRLWMTKKRDGCEYSVRWLSYLLSSKPQKETIKGLATGTSGSMKNISKSALLDLQIPFPPPSEQRAIATALSDVDALLEGLDRLITKKRDLKQAAMQQLLTGQIRLPGFEGEWETKPLGETSESHRKHVVPALFGEELFTHFSLPAFDDGQGPVIESGSSIGSNKFRVPDGAILVSKLNPRIPRVWLADNGSLNPVASTEFLLLTARQGISREFLYVVCSSPAFCEQLELSATGTTGSHQRIAPSDAMKISVRIPVDPSEQSAIATVLSDMDAGLEALEQRRAKTAVLKLAMMQELLTGRTRLVTEEAAA